MIEDNWFFADLHIHSRFSRACSKDLTIPNLVKWAKIKGINLLGTGDFTHPVWIQELKDTLEEREGFYYYKDFPFVITGEVSLIYTDKGKGRRVHLVILVPSIEVAEKINSYFDSFGRRDYDGRPIFKIPCKKLVKDLREISKEIEIIPAHIWTPWFGILGSMSGYDSLEDAFGDQLRFIHAIETGISSDPQMNVRLKELGKMSIVSFSDSHSFWPYRMGREATIFKKPGSYFELIEQIRKNDFIGTIETDPSYGKYHHDGHRNCGVSFNPKETREVGGICPKCKKRLTLGVEYRVDQLSQFEEGEKENKLFFRILPLHEIISFYVGFGMTSKKVWGIYEDLIAKFSNELNVLLNVSKEEMLGKEIDSSLVDLILKNREGKIKVKPGYDGVYGEATL
jgi:uncharacterized protein (TIGR00375 family)